MSGKSPSTFRCVNRFKRIVYVAGPGDVLGTYKYWLRGLDDPSQVSITYSSLFYDLCRELDIHALVIATHSPPDSLHDGWIRIEHRRIPWPQGSGIYYHLGRVWYLVGVMASAIRFRADVVVVANISHWYLLSLLRLFGIEVITSLHCTLWPVLNRPRRFVPRVLLKLNGWFWRRAASATICVSPECEQQMREIARTVNGPVYQSRAQYHREEFQALSAPRFEPGSRFRVMFAGRIERNKGVFDVLAVAEELERRHPGLVEWEIVGSGGAEADLRAAVDAAGLADLVHLRGYLNRTAMLEELSRAHAVIVPTTTNFAEGLNKVAVEGILAGRPVVTTVLSNAVDLLGEAAVEVPPGDIQAYADAIYRLAGDPKLLDRKRRACQAVREQFFDPNRSWGATLKQALLDLSRVRDVNAANVPTEAKISGEDYQEIETPSQFETSSIRA
jgi:glycogen synthase